MHVEELRRLLALRKTHNTTWLPNVPDASARLRIAGDSFSHPLRWHGPQPGAPKTAGGAVQLPRSDPDLRP